MTAAADEVVLHYILSTYPLAQETFVTGEIRAMAARLPEVSITGMVRSDEVDMRPGGIPPSVPVEWIPRPSSPGFWTGLLGALARRRGSVLRDWASMRATDRPAWERLRWQRMLMGASAHAARKRPSVAGGDHLHAHFAARGAVGAYLVSRAWKVPFSMTVHAFDLFRPNPRLPTLARQAALTVAISDYDRVEMLRLVPDLDPSRVEVIHVGVPVAGLAALGRYAATSTASDSRVPLIVSAGRLVEKKGMEVLIRAVAELSGAGVQLRCQIIGDGPLRPGLERLVRDLGMSELVTLHGALPPDETRRLIAGAELFVLACVRAANGDMDGIPVALMEAMAAGTPVISTRLSGIPELIADGRHGLLAEPADVGGLAAAIRLTLSDREGVLRRAAAARQVVTSGFDQDANAGRLLSAIRAARERVGGSEDAGLSAPR